MSRLKEFTASVDKLIKVLPSLPKNSSSTATTKLGRELAAATELSVAALASIKIAKDDLYEDRILSLVAIMRSLADKETTSESDLDSLRNVVDQARRLIQARVCSVQLNARALKKKRQREEEEEWEAQHPEEAAQHAQMMKDRDEHMLKPLFEVAADGTAHLTAHHSYGKRKTKAEQDQLAALMAGFADFAKDYMKQGK
ncbi:hypothetical protein JCM3766R1_000437 [Sporobolomyces carnicolor]